MKKIIVFGFITFLLYGCAQDDFMSSGSNIISSHLDEQMMDGVIQNVNNLFALPTNDNRRRTVSAKISEEQAQIALAPLASAGIEMQKDLITLNSSNRISLTHNELQTLENLTDIDLATLAYVSYIIEETGSIPSDEELAKIKIDSSSLEKTLTRADYLDCLTLSLGFSAATSLGGYIKETKACMNVTTVRALLGKLAGRTLGWAGLVFVVHDYTECVEGKKKQIK